MAGGWTIKRSCTRATWRCHCNVTSLVHKELSERLFPISSDAIGQIAQAWEIIGFLGSSDFTRGPTGGDIHNQLVEDAQKIVLDASAVLELRAAALALVIKGGGFLYFSEDVLSKILPAWLTSLDAIDVELFDQVLYATNAPPLETILEVKESIDRHKLRTHLQGVSPIDLLKIQALNPLTTQQVTEVFGAVVLTKNGRSTGTTTVSHVKAGQRILTGYHHQLENITLPCAFVVAAFAALTGVIASNVSQQWRALETLKHLCSLSWADDGNSDLVREISIFCDTVQKRLAHTPRKFALIALMTKLAQNDQNNWNTCKLLEIFNLIPKNMGDYAFMTSVARSRAANHSYEDTVAKLLAIATKSNEALFGFLKILSPLEYLLRRTHHGPVRLALDNQKVMSILGNAEYSQDLREGALLLLAQSSVSLQAIKDIVKVAATTHGTRVWTELLMERFLEPDSQQGADFLETVLSGAQSAPYLREASLEEYRRIMVGATPDIMQREKELAFLESSS